MIKILEYKINFLIYYFYHFCNEILLNKNTKKSIKRMDKIEQQQLYVLLIVNLQLYQKNY
jgi:hypothetical protein